MNQYMPKRCQHVAADQVKEDGSEMTPRELSDIKEAQAKAKREANPEALGKAKGKPSFER